MYSVISNLVGHPQIGLGNIDKDTLERLSQGGYVSANDPWWGGGEFIWGRATAAIRAQGLCTMLPVFDATLGKWRYDVTEVANTANLGRALCVVMGAPAAAGQYGWFMVSGVAPVNCNASVAADTTFGIAAAGQGGANSAGKQVLGGRIVAAAATTVVKANMTGVAGGRQIALTNTDGLFVGVYVAGTGIPAAATVVAIDPSGRHITISADLTAVPSGNLTATYNNAAIFYNVAHLQRPVAQGAIT